MEVADQVRAHGDGIDREASVGGGDGGADVRRIGRVDQLHSGAAQPLRRGTVEDGADNARAKGLRRRCRGTHRHHGTHLRGEHRGNGHHQHEK